MGTTLVEAPVNGICRVVPLACARGRLVAVSFGRNSYNHSRLRLFKSRAFRAVGGQVALLKSCRAWGSSSSWRKSIIVNCGGSNGAENNSVVLKPANDGSKSGGRVDKEGESGFSIGGDGDAVEEVRKEDGNGTKDLQILKLKELLRLSQVGLKRARENSTKVESEAQKFAERAISLRDQAAAAVSAADAAKSLLQEQAAREGLITEALKDAKVLLDAAKVRLNSVEQAVPNIFDSGARIEGGGDDSGKGKVVREVETAQLEIRKCEDVLKSCQLELSGVHTAKLELEKEAVRLAELAEVAKAVALSADEDVAMAMVLAENAVALEVEAAQRLSDAEIALQKVESQLKEVLDVVEPVISPPSKPVDAGDSHPPENGFDKPADLSLLQQNVDSSSLSAQGQVAEDKAAKNVTADEAPEIAVEKAKEILEKMKTEAESSRKGDGKDHLDSVGTFPRKIEGKDGVDPGVVKSFTNKSSRFFPASFFSFGEAEDFSPSSVFSGLVSTVRSNLPKVVVATALLLGGGIYVGGRLDKLTQLSSYDIASNIEEVTTSTKPLVKKIYKMRYRVKSMLDKMSRQEVNEEETSLLDVLWLLLASVVFVPLFQKIPGGSPVLGYLAAGVLIGPHSLHIIQNVHGTKAIAELGVVFLLFNIGLELSVERLSSMRKYVFGFGSGQVLLTALATGLFVHYISRVSVPAAIVIGNGLALSSTAVVLQVLQERGESTSRHGRAAFSVLLFQDLAVVVLLILIPLISPNSSKGGVGFNAIAEALGIAAIKGVIAISGIIAGGRLLLRPIYRSMAENHNAEIFAANTLLVVLGTSVLTARAGLSMALGSFLAGLLLSETEFALQVESDIAPYRGLLLGLFFMTVGMSIDPNLFVAKFPIIMGSLALLVLGKGSLIALLGRQFGLSNVAAVRAGLLLAPGGEFAFVAFGEAVNQGIMSHQLSSLLFLVVGLSMAITPWLAAAGQLIASKFDQQDVRSLLPAENETDDLQGHMIVCGFGRVGQIISQMLSERLIPFVALDVRSERVSMGRSLDFPVYFGDAGSKEVLHKLGAERAAAAVITLDTPGANYRAVWALSKHFPNVKTYVRAHDVDHGINLEKAGATAVVPETLEPSLQLAAAILAEAKLPAAEIASTINEFRSRHLAELTELTRASGTSLGYGFSQTAKSKPEGSKPDEEGRKFGGVVAVP